MMEIALDRTQSKSRTTYNNKDLVYKTIELYKTWNP